jgi:hypothetical protein
MIIFKEQKHMDIEEFEKFTPILIEHIQKNLKIPKENFRLEFIPSPCLGEEDNEIAVFIDSDYIRSHNVDFEKSESFYHIHCDENGDTKEWYEKFGAFYIAFARDISEKVTDVVVGDLVLLENDILYHDPDVGIITSVIECKGERLFGCSYFDMHCCTRYDHLVKITAGDYGGYKKGFAKKLTIQEAEEILKSKLEKTYKRILSSLDQEKEDSEKFISKILREVNNVCVDTCSVEKCEQLVFKEYDGKIDKTLIRKRY